MGEIFYPQCALQISFQFSAGGRVSETVECFIYLSQKLTETVKQLRSLWSHLGQQRARMVGEQARKMRTVILVIDSRDFLAGLRPARLRNEPGSHTTAEMRQPKDIVGDL
jgi:hypothetical protein